MADLLAALEQEGILPNTSSDLSTELAKETAERKQADTLLQSQINESGVKLGDGAANGRVAIWQGSNQLGGDPAVTYDNISLNAPALRASSQAGVGERGVLAGENGLQRAERKLTWVPGADVPGIAGVTSVLADFGATIVDSSVGGAPTWTPGALILPFVGMAGDAYLFRLETVDGSFTKRASFLWDPILESGYTGCATFETANPGPTTCWINWETDPGTYAGTWGGGYSGSFVINGSTWPATVTVAVDGVLTVPARLEIGPDAGLRVLDHAAATQRMQTALPDGTLEPVPKVVWKSGVTGIEGVTSVTVDYGSTTLDSNVSGVPTWVPGVQTLPFVEMVGDAYSFVTAYNDGEYSRSASFLWNPITGAGYASCGTWVTANPAPTVCWVEWPTDPGTYAGTWSGGHSESYVINGSTWPASVTVTATQATADGLEIGPDAYLKVLDHAGTGQRMLTAQTDGTHTPVNNVTWDDAAALLDIDGDLGVDAIKLDTTPPTRTRVEGECYWSEDGLEVEGGLADLNRQDAALREPTGFEDPKSVGVSYDSAARTITLTQAGGIVYWYQGTRYQLASPWTSSAHTATNGSWFLMFSTGGSIVWSNTVWDFEANGPVAYVDYNNPVGVSFGVRECHGLMPWQVHRELHDQIGTYRRSGGIPTAGTYALNTDTAAAITPGFDAAEILDEDCPSTIPALTEGSYTHISIGVAGVITVRTAEPYLTRTTGTYPNWNNATTGADVEAATGDFLNVYQILLPATSDAGSQTYRMLFLQPQVAHASLAAAQAEDFRSLSLGNLAGLSPEFVAFTRLTFSCQAANTTVGKVRLAALAYITGARASQTTLSSVTPTSHTALADRSVADQHPQSAVTNLVADLAAKFDKAGGAIGVDPGGSELLRVGGRITAGTASVAGLVTLARAGDGLRSGLLGWYANDDTYFGVLNGSGAGMVDLGANVSGFIRFGYWDGSVFSPQATMSYLGDFACKTEVIGTDPGGSELLRVGGNGHFKGDTLLLESSSAAYVTHRIKNTEREWHTGVEGAAGGAWYLYDATAAAVRLRVNYDGTMVLGTDTGGSELLRVGGNIRTSRMWTATPSDESQLYLKANIAAAGAYYFAQADTFKGVVGASHAGTNEFLVGQYAGGGNNCSIFLGAAITEILRVDESSTADDIRLFIYDASAGALKRVLRGPADSAGTGYRSLRIVN
jgi:hypothetical protein